MIHISNESFLTAKATLSKISDLAESVPVWHKECLTIEEASKLYGIGMNRLRSMTDGEDCPFVLHVGSKRLIKRRRFDDYINADYCYSI